MIHIDKDSSKKNIFVVVDSCSKFVKLYPTKTTATQEVMNALREYFRYYSRPRYIVSDRGSCLTSNDFKKITEDNDIQHIKIATFSPEANGQVERVNRNLGPMIAKLIDTETNITWVKTLETVEFALNNSFHRMINEYPSVMLFGVNQRGKISDQIKENIMNEDVRDLSSVSKCADNRQRSAQQYNKNYTDSKRKQPTMYKQGDYVVIKNIDTTIGTSKKFIPKFKGPFVVTEVLPNDRYVLQDVEGFQQSRIPYKGVWAAHNMKLWHKGSSHLSECDLQDSQQRTEPPIANDINVP